MAADYDIITVGGGLGGASLAKVMAEHGSRVLVVERETEFKDRVRGEAMSPWGVTDSRRIGILDVLMDAGGHELPRAQAYAGPVMIQALEGEDAIAVNRRLMGATNPAEADADTIRAVFAESIEANAVHGSDAPETAATEIAYFFGD